MALTIPELQALRETLIRARLGGVREVVDQNGERLSWKSDREQAAALASVESQIAAMQAGQSPNVIKFRARRGI